MNADIRTDGEVVVVKLSGKIDYESADTFKARVINQLGYKKVVFNLRDLSFVGSVGITPFMQAIENLYQLSPQTMKLCGVGIEFQRVFEASNVQGLEIYENEEGAVNSFRMPQTFIESPQYHTPVTASHDPIPVDSILRANLNNIESE